MNAALEYLITGVEPQKWGSEHAQQVPYKAFKTADGWAVIGAGFPNFYASFCKLLGREDLITDPRFADMPGRVKNREILYGMLDAEVAKHPTTKLIAELEAVKVPCAPVNNMQQVFSHRQVKHRGMQQTLRHRSYGEVPSLGAAVKYSGFDVTAGWTAPPLLGEDSEAVLQEWLGLGTGEIAELRAAKAI